MIGSLPAHFSHNWHMIMWVSNYMYKYPNTTFSNWIPTPFACKLPAF